MRSKELPERQIKADGAGPKGATVVITHRVRDGHQDEYDRWLDEIGPICRATPGLLDWQIIRPIAGVTGTYTVIIRYDTREHLEQWMRSQARAALIDKVRPLLATDDDFYIRSGLDFWFVPEGANARVPVRWKQFLATWSALLPLIYLVPMALGPVLRAAGVPAHPLLDLVLFSGITVALMVYLVMPRYTHLLRRWLFR